VTLEIGGAVETYWKSLAVPHAAPAPVAKTATPRLSRARQLGSTQLGSPTGSPITVSSKAQPITISSITGSYVYITVQVTQDLQPVVFGEWQLPQQDFDLWVADVTLAQFEALARRKGRELRANNTSSGVTASTPSEWHSLIRRSMVSLENLLKVREPSSISSSVVHWATKTDYYRLHTHMRLSVLVLAWSWWDPFHCFIELYILSLPPKINK
jgi:CDK inhibitor PHO81